MPSSRARHRRPSAGRPRALSRIALVRLELIAALEFAPERRVIDDLAVEDDRVAAVGAGIGWCPPSTSMMLRRRMPKPKSPSVIYGVIGTAIDQAIALAGNRFRHRPPAPSVPAGNAAHEVQAPRASPQDRPAPQRRLTGAHGLGASRNRLTLRKFNEGVMTACGRLSCGPRLFMNRRSGPDSSRSPLMGPNCAVPGTRRTWRCVASASRILI